MAVATIEQLIERLEIAGLVTDALEPLFEGEAMNLTAVDVVLRLEI
ncbi:MAG: hypothetical protein ACFBSC_10310 [Microcoleaceae cyanobacterium]